MSRLQSKSADALQVVGAFNNLYRRVNSLFSLLVRVPS
jgi:hypothetical protein